MNSAFWYRRTSNKKRISTNHIAGSPRAREPALPVAESPRDLALVSGPRAPVDVGAACAMCRAGKSPRRGASTGTWTCALKRHPAPYLFAFSSSGSRHHCRRSAAHWLLEGFAERGVGLQPAVDHAAMGTRMRLLLLLLLGGSGRCRSPRPRRRQRPRRQRGPGRRASSDRETRMGGVPGPSSNERRGKGNGWVMWVETK